MILDVGLAVRVITGVRTHTAMSSGCLEWEAEGVRAALIKTEGSPGAVLAAACLAAEDASLRLPSPNAFANHWPVNASTTAPTHRQILECPEHRQSLPCGPCKEVAGPELTPQQRADAAAECRRIAKEAMDKAAAERRAITERQEAAK